MSDDPTTTQDQEALRAEIEQTREELGETVEALAHKADVPGRAKEKVEESKQALHDKQDEVSQLAAQAQEQATAKVHQVQEQAPDNLPYIAGAAAAGLLLALIIWRRR